MKFKVLTENIRLVPAVCSELEGEFALIFRQPTQFDIADMATVTSTKDIIKVMDGLLVEIENKPEIEGVEYKTLTELCQYNSPVITSVMADVVKEFARIRNEAFNIEKKS